jgi:type IV pilus assembly protein PilB
MSSFGFVGDLLIRKSLVDAAGLARAVEAQAAQPSTLGRALARLGLADESVVAVETACALHLAFFEYDDDHPPPVDAKAVAILPAEFCRKRGVLPLAVEGGVLKVAVIDPLDDSALQDVKFRTGKKITAVVVTQTGFDRLYARLHPEKSREVAYDMLATAAPSGEVELTNDEEYELVDPEKLAKGVKLPPIIRLVNLILSDAASAGASDVHVEPQEKCLQVRQRVDGMLRDVLTIPHHLQDQTVSRFKIMSGMDIAERRKPQDGRSRLRFEGRRIELRVSTLPTQFGEKVVIRLLNSDRAILPMDQINLAPHPLRVMKGFLARPQGMILVTGPTGSGKTSTLYTALNSIKSSSNNIITLEDPIEFQLPGVNQTQINAKAGVTFASGLRSILRQDPNVILVGEIRDPETAEIAMQAALTGHLLLSTLHTNDAPGTITRLIDLGIAPFLVASSLLGIVAQRLVRRPCPACAVSQQPSAELIERVGGAARLRADGQWVAGQGCPKCAGSGIKGRLAIHEMLEINNEVRDLINNRGSEQAIRNAGRRNGMRTLFEDGLDKAAQGLTTIEEVLRVVSQDEPAEGEGQVAQPTAPQASSAHAQSAQDETAHDPSGPRRRVLVVEDSQTIASVVKYFLELEGFEVLVADNGRTGLATALKERPDFIVSDVNMPDMGGVEMVRTIRADPRMAGVRILMLTSESSVDCEAEGLAAGADDYILKPVEPRRLAARVKALLARSGNRAA